MLTQGGRLAQVRVSVADDGRALLAFQRFRSDDQDERDRPTDVTRIAPTAKRRRGGPVRRVGILKRTLSSGPESLAVSGRSRCDALSRGRYILRVRAVDSAGNLSHIEGVSFTVC
ncbi:MAG: hypothetical protein QOD83_3931 [Solirubrobacteraceae bacterium]|nr:hypothetical protein [Solirubrobacteraceae bacterium]